MLGFDFVPSSNVSLQPRVQALPANWTEPRPEIKLLGESDLELSFSLFFFSSHGDGYNAVRPDAFFFFKHIWLRAVGGFGFLIHSNFLVEVVVVLRAVGGGGGGYGCGILGLPLVVVVELG